ncbi:MAG: hypothetical protein K9M00_02965 [Candidatus Omnitrophica bacterium]|nr:hypothetical protein [Candidatus Omnitrophota bacterium]
MLSEITKKIFLPYKNKKIAILSSAGLGSNFLSYFSIICGCKTKLYFIKATHPELDSYNKKRIKMLKEISSFLNQKASILELSPKQYIKYFLKLDSCYPDAFLEDEDTPAIYFALDKIKERFVFHGMGLNEMENLSYKNAKLYVKNQRIKNINLHKKISSYTKKEIFFPFLEDKAILDLFLEYKKKETSIKKILQQILGNKLPKKLIVQKSQHTYVPQDILKIVDKIHKLKKGF